MNMVDIKSLIEIANKAGELVLSIYHQGEIEITNKADKTPLTRADLNSHSVICESLGKLYPHIPIISEEFELQQQYNIRKKWDYFFLIDPLDGTKEFIKRNGEFTINIALIHQQKPILGVIHAPALHVTYYAQEGKGAFKMINNKALPLPRKGSIAQDNLRIIMSRSHLSDETKMFVNKLTLNGSKKVTAVTAGSALKFGLIAEGSADIYPRLAPTMEWDTAAGHIIVNEVGKKVMLFDGDKELQYNKMELVNPSFIVQ